MIKPSIRLQDLRWGIYAKQKADSTGTDGVGIGGTNPRCGTARTESTTSLIGHINLGEEANRTAQYGKSVRWVACPMKAGVFNGKA